MTTTFRIKDGDIAVDARTGRPAVTVDRAKLSQDLRELFEIEEQPNGFGAGLEDLIGLVGDIFAFRAELSARVYTALEAMRTLQRRYHIAQRPREERIHSLVNLGVAQVVPPGGLDASKTAYAFKADILTEIGGEPVSAGSLIIR